MRHHYEADYYAKICKASSISSIARARRTQTDVHRLPPVRHRRPTASNTWPRCWTISCRTIGWQATTDEIAEYYLANYYESGGPRGTRQPIRSILCRRANYVFSRATLWNDHDHYDWSPLNTTRAALTWPAMQSGSVRYRDLEHMEWSRPPAATSYPISRWLWPGPFPDVTPGHIASMPPCRHLPLLDVLDRRGSSPPLPWMSSPLRIIRSGTPLPGRGAS